MKDQHDMMVEAQARIITNHNERLKLLQEEVCQLQAHVAAIQTAAHEHFYNKLQRAIMDNEALQPLWDEFITSLILIVPESKDWTLKDMPVKFQW